MYNISTNNGKIKVNINKIVDLGFKKVAVYGWYVPLVISAINPSLHQFLPILAIGMPTCSLFTNELIINNEETKKK